MAEKAAAPGTKKAAPPTMKTEDGVNTIRLGSWGEFAEFMIRMPPPAVMIWRGQQRDDELRPSLDRELLGKTQDQHRACYREQLGRFKVAVAGRRGLNPRNLDGEKDGVGEFDEWWALGQQNGLKTPLLDWTDSPFGALFFAFEKPWPEGEPTGSRFRYVYAINPRSLNDQHREELLRAMKAWAADPLPEPDVDYSDFASSMEHYDWEQKKKERTEVPWIRVIRPHTDENIRLLSQGGLFTQAPPERAIEEFVREHFKGQRGRRPMLKFIIRESKEDDREECLATLNRMGINHRTLFPDLHGASLYVNTYIKMPRY